MHYGASVLLKISPRVTLLDKEIHPRLFGFKSRLLKPSFNAGMNETINAGMKRWLRAILSSTSLCRDPLPERGWADGW